jgi:hypothetical protein
MSKKTKTNRASVKRHTVEHGSWRADAVFPSFRMIRSDSDEHELAEIGRLAIKCQFAVAELNKTELARIDAQAAFNNAAQNLAKRLGKTSR